ncbi:hypothetical protein POM88_033183 [Heracleum sosnowskyi]|uniref:Uncharacterized protein n=1 Tax=Heracleum sosnowskyi TaxID=360622 RepID=A0AAD8I3Q0_9APIA|nr:hypothetical protein POM88_033183 [Heracleum sosnowskyi]
MAVTGASVQLNMKGQKIQIAVILVFVLVLCVSSVTFAGQSECCIDCRQACCEGGVPPSETCFNACVPECPDAPTCPDCTASINLIGKRTARTIVVRYVAKEVYHPAKPVSMLAFKDVLMLLPAPIAVLPSILLVSGLRG